MGNCCLGLDTMPTARAPSERETLKPSSTHLHLRPYAILSSRKTTITHMCVLVEALTAEFPQCRRCGWWRRWLPWRKRGCLNEVTALSLRRGRAARTAEPPCFISHFSRLPGPWDWSRCCPPVR
jgi:hypothetical protein